MSQDLISNQDALAGGQVAGGFNTTTSYATGTVVPFSGTYVAKNKYMDLFQVYGQNEIFQTDAAGKKTSWTALNPTTTVSSSDGGFNSVKVAPGTV